MREERSLGGSKFHRSLKSEEHPIVRRVVSQVAKIVEQGGARCHQVGMDELAAFALPLEVSHLDGEGGGWALRLARVLEGEGGGHVAGGQTKNRIGYRGHCVQEPHGGVERGGEGRREGVGGGEGRKRVE